MSVDRPQRIVVSAPPGSLLKREVAPPRRHKTDGDHDHDYLAQVRVCPCLHCGLDPCYEAAHIRFASGSHGKASGMGKKPADRYALPLCPTHHRLARDCQHAGSERLFWSRLGINPLLVAERLYAQRGDLVAMRAVVFVAISERGNGSLPDMQPADGGGHCP